MIGRSPAFELIQTLIDKMAAYDAPVLIEGETGTGKELVARAIHYRGLRRGRPFVPLNCGALPDQLIENELFGHRRGAFTDARDDRPGLVELALFGTLFLDEVDALTPKAQITLLRFLQDQQFRPLGGAKEQQADVRIVAASNRNLAQAVVEGTFRLDLLYRLKVFHIEVPPLRERLGDQELLANHFIRVAAARYNKPPLPLEASTLAWFGRYAWPGNIRELENLIVREFLLAESDTVSIPTPASAREDETAKVSFNYKVARCHAITQFERTFLAKLLGHAKGNVSEAARISGTERRHLGRLLKRHGITKLTSSRAGFA
jgi:DNA-binding NtrC family response regulator